MSGELTPLLSLACGSAPILVYVSGQVRQYRTPYSEADLAAAGDFFLSRIYVDEVNPAHFHPTAIDTILTNTSRLSVLNYHSSWNPAVSYLEQLMHPIPGWPLHSIHAFHRWHPPKDNICFVGG